MAIIHPATIKPTKAEVVDAWLGGPSEILGAYRYDDPDGEVGVEAFVVRRGVDLHHVVLTYRGESVDGPVQVATMEHSTLGPRWVYDGTTDPAALACSERAILEEQEQAPLEVWEDGVLIEVREPTVRITRQPGDGRELRIARELTDSGTWEGAHLVATWDCGTAVVARLT